jgi:recombination protein RecA
MTDKFIEELIDEFGEGVHSSKTEKLEVIPTGSLSLDVSMGVGGIPRGRFTEIYGPDSAGKTTLALSIARSAIKQGLKVLFVDVENLTDYEAVEGLLGEKLPDDKLYIVHPETAEDAFVIAEKGIDSGEFELIIFDSVGALAPKKVKEDDFADANVAIVPRLLTKFLIRNHYSVRMKKIAFIFINQVRDTIGAYVSMYSTPGGHAIKHLSSIIVAMNKGQEIKQGDETIGLNIKFVVKKNKLAAPFRGFTIPIIFGKGIDSLRDFVLFSEMLGALSRKGSYYVFEGDNIGQGVVKTMAHLSEHPDMLDRIRALTFSIINKTIPPKEEVAIDEELPLDEEIGT